MDNIEYLFAGFAVFWAGLFLYLLLLQVRLRSLSREIEHLEERLAEADRVASAHTGPAATSRPSTPGPVASSAAAASERREAAEQGA